MVTFSEGFEGFIILGFDGFITLGFGGFIRGIDGVLSLQWDRGMSS
jgi:hypothetical protein